MGSATSDGSMKSMPTALASLPDTPIAPHSRRVREKAARHTGLGNNAPERNSACFHPRQNPPPALNERSSLWKPNPQRGAIRGRRPRVGGEDDTTTQASGRPRSPRPMLVAVWRQSTKDSPRHVTAPRAGPPLVTGASQQVVQKLGGYAAPGFYSLVVSEHSRTTRRPSDQLVVLLFAARQRVQRNLPPRTGLRPAQTQRVCTPPSPRGSWHASESGPNERFRRSEGLHTLGHSGPSSSPPPQTGILNHRFVSPKAIADAAQVPRNHLMDSVIAVQQEPDAATQGAAAQAPQFARLTPVARRQ